MHRPTIPDLAAAAGVSVSTVNRILYGSAKVRPDTIERVTRAAKEIGFYGLGTLRQREHDSRPHYQFGFVLQQSTRQVYQLFASGILDAARKRSDARVEPDLHFVDDLAPASISSALLTLGERCDALAVICADHPQVSQAVNTLRENDVPVIAYISDLSALSRAGFVGTDNWKLGRAAAYFIANMARHPGRIATFIGNHRYQSQDISDASFRSYIREHAPQMTVLDPFMTHEDPEVAYDLVQGILASEADLVGLFVNGGGISGALRALREQPQARQARIRVICRDIGMEARKGLHEGLISVALCHPLERTSSELISAMIEALGQKKHRSIIQRTVPLEVLTPESI